MSSIIREIELDGNVARLILDNTHSRVLLVYGGEVIEEYSSRVWDNIKDDGWIIDVFFNFAIERYISSKPSKEYLDALASINGSFV